MSENSTTYDGIGFVDLLQIVLIVLKILGKITWSWWIVLLPFEISLGITAIFGIILLIMFLS